MPRSKIRYLRTRSLDSNSILAQIIVRLMMSLNDISIVYHSFSQWSGPVITKYEHRIKGARLYFGRMMSGHLYEALIIVREISRSRPLTEKVYEADASTISDFKELLSFIKSKDFDTLRELRNAASFHYDEDLAKNALTKIIARAPDKITDYSVGSTAIDWYFRLGDMVVDTIIVDEVLKIPDSPDRREKLNEVLIRHNRVSAVFADFAANFIGHHVSRWQ